MQAVSANDLSQYASYGATEGIRTENSNDSMNEEASGSTEGRQIGGKNEENKTEQACVQPSAREAGTSSNQEDGLLQTECVQMSGNGSRLLDEGKAERNNELNVSVYMMKERRLERVPLETYVLGVLAGEMPAEFELEALKAQAIAARTYITRRLLLLRENEDDSVPEGADVTDTIAHQVYVSKEQLASKWKGEASGKANLAKLKQAVEETKGLIITYAGEPIEASFFSTSNGYTENSEDYWGQELPYLRSVDSPWDIGLSPRYKETIVLKQEELYDKLGLTGKQAAKKLAMKVLKRTEGNRIQTIRVNGVEFSGREFRERLGLASSQFDWSIDKQKIAVTTYGYGHGVGMSQWGANGMALEGRSAIEIVRYYYTGTRVEQASKLLTKSKS